VIVAFGENSGGYGGTVAAPMVKALMTTWFSGAAGGAGAGAQAVTPSDR
jgi:penicillin-binding protein 2